MYCLTNITLTTVFFLSRVIKITIHEEKKTKKMSQEITENTSTANKLYKLIDAL